jgi:hypothetical protein
MIFALLVCLPEGEVIAQPITQIDINEAPLVFATTDQGITFTVEIEPAGFIFDANNTQYYPTLPTFLGATVVAGDAKGYAIFGTQIVSQEVNPVDEIGCGLYKITISEQDCDDVVFTLNTMDANWMLTGGATYGIVIWLEKSLNHILAYATVGIRDNSALQELYGYFPTAALEYWDMIRATVKTDYVRERDGFTLPTGNYPVGFDDLTLDVNVTITSTGGSGNNIAVGYGKTFRIQNDVWNWTYDPDGWFTTLQFEAGTGFSVNSGSLLADLSTGLVYWEPASTTWSGVSIATTAPVILHGGYISGSSGTGLTFNNCNSGNVDVEAYSSVNNGNSGLRVSSSDPTFLFCDFSDNSRSGADIQSYSDVSFDHSYFGGNGLYGANISGGTVLLQDCQVYGNTQHGVYVPSGGAQVRVKDCIIRNHASTHGIHMNNVGSTGFVELQNSCVYQNRVGLYMTGTSILRGWHRTLPVGSECSETDVTGMNRISENDVNIQADGSCMIDLGREYTSGGGTVCTLGGQNDIVSPSTTQVDLNNGADASLVDCYWGGDYSFNINGGATLDYSPEVWASNGACQESAPSALVEQLPEGIRELVELTGLVLDPDRSVISQIAKALKAHTTLEATEMRENVSPKAPVPLTVSPNPFNSGATFQFTLPLDETLTLRVFDVLGRQVAMVAQGRYATGRHDLPFLAGELPAGVYTAVLHTASRIVASTRFVLSR